MPLCNHSLNLRLVRSRTASHHEERCLSSILCQTIHNSIADRRLRTIIKRQRYHRLRRINLSSCACLILCLLRCSSCCILSWLRLLRRCLTHCLLFLRSFTLYFVRLCILRLCTLPHCDHTGGCLLLRCRSNARLLTHRTCTFRTLRCIAETNLPLRFCGRSCCHTLSNCNHSRTRPSRLNSNHGTYCCCQHRFLPFSHK